MFALIFGWTLSTQTPVCAGMDLAAWRAISEVEDAQRVEALREFVLEYPNSSLAEVAWSWLEAEGAEDGAWSRPVRGEVVKLRRSLKDHREELEQRGAWESERRGLLRR